MKTLFNSILRISVIANILLVLFACSKYQDGGLIGKADKHLTSVTWKLSSYLRNGIDETASIHVSNWTEHYMNDGTLHRNFTDLNGDSQQQTGSWEFIDENQNLKIDGVGSIDLSPQTGTVSASQIKIIKLTKDSFWYTFTNGSDEHEFHLIPN